MDGKHILLLELNINLLFIYMLYIVFEIETKIYLLIRSHMYRVTDRDNFSNNAVLLFYLSQDGQNS